MTERSSQLVEEPLGPIDIGTENLTGNLPIEQSTEASGKQETTFYDQRTEMNRNEMNQNVDDEDRNEDPLKNVIPMEKLKNGAANAMEFLNWGFQAVKEQADKVQETEGFRKLEEATQEVRKRASSAIEASKPRLNEFGNAVAETATNAYEKAKPTLEEIGTNAQQSFETAKERVVQTTEACKPSVQRAAESANIGMNNAYTETKTFIEKITKS